LMRLARQFQLRPEQVKGRLIEIRNSLRPLSNRKDEPAVEQRIDYAKFKRNEAELIQLLIQSPSLLDAAIEKVVPGEFVHGPLRDLYGIMEDFFHDGKEVGYEQLMLELEDVRLKSLVDYLYDEATAKKQAAESQKTDFFADLDTQLESVIETFSSRREESGFQAKISQLHGGQLDANEETQALMELFAKQQQKQRSKK